MSERGATPERNQASGLAWRTSSFSGGDGCVDVAPYGNGGAAVRHSKKPDSAVIYFTEREWTAFIQGVMNSEFTFSRENGTPDLA